VLRPFCREWWADALLQGLLDHETSAGGYRLTARKSIELAHSKKNNCCVEQKLLENGEATVSYLRVCCCKSLCKQKSCSIFYAFHKDLRKQLRWAQSEADMSNVALLQGLVPTALLQGLVSTALLRKYNQEHEASKIAFSMAIA